MGEKTGRWGRQRLVVDPLLSGRNLEQVTDTCQEEKNEKDNETVRESFGILQDVLAVSHGLSLDTMKKKKAVPAKMKVGTSHTSVSPFINARETYAGLIISALRVERSRFVVNIPAAVQRDPAPVPIR